MSILGPALHVQTPAQFPTTKVAYQVYGFVRTDVPGYRELSIGSHLYRVPSGTYRWDEFITQMDSDLTALSLVTVFIRSGSTPGPIAIEEAGVGSHALGFPDRLGWLLGFGVEAGTSLAVATDRYGPFIPPGGLPVIGADWSDVTLDRETQASFDRHLRGSGFAWGGARLWRVVLTMSRWHLEAFTAGWLRRGRIAIVPTGYESTAMSGSQPKGYLDGRMVSDVRARWIDPLERFAEANFILATAAT